MKYDVVVIGAGASGMMAAKIKSHKIHPKMIAPMSCSKPMSTFGFFM